MATKSVPNASRLEKAVEAFSLQTGFEFVVTGPEAAIDVQRQGDEGSVLEVNVAAQPPRFHPGADGDAAFFDEVDTGKEFVETLQQFGLPQFGGLGDAFLVLEQFDKEEAGTVAGGGRVGQEAPTQRRVPA